jgi:hypothetical protein
MGPAWDGGRFALRRRLQSVTAQPLDAHWPVPRDPAAIRAGLSPQDRELFDAEYAVALEAARPPAYDITGLLGTLERWRRVVLLAAGNGAARDIADRELAGLDIDGLVPVTLAELRA